MIYEATISTLEDPAQTAARFLEPQLEQKRPGHSPQPAPDRSQASDAGLKPMAEGKPGRLRFGRAARIKQARDFAAVRRVGERLVNGCLIANWRRLESPAVSRLGVITAGKLGNAIVRNRARRLLRESFRLHQHELAKPVDLVLVARQSIVGKAFAGVEKDFLTTLRKAGLLKERSGI